MTDPRGWGLSEQHLLPDAVVAFVDGEMSASARDRAAAHMIRCPYCAAEITAQRQVRAAVRAADTPGTPAGLLATLRAIPNEVELPGAPDQLAVADDGQLMTVQRRPHGRNTPLGSGPMLGSTVTPLGEGSAVLGRGRRSAQGASVVVSGLVLGALALATSSASPGNAQPERAPVQEPPRAVAGEPAGLTQPCSLDVRAAFPCP
jgi:anti-sigma factor RsiW